MSLFKHPVLVRDIILVLASLLGIIIIFFLNLKEIGIRMYPIGRRISDLKNMFATDEDIFLQKNMDWYGSVTSHFPIACEKDCDVWQITLFSAKIVRNKQEFISFSGSHWYEFASSATAAEKIMAPIVRKIFLKYRNHFEKIYPIQILRDSKHTGPLYTWLPNETHIHQVAFDFLNETLAFLSNELVSPRLIIVWDETISFEIIVTYSESILEFTQGLQDVLGLECHNDRLSISIKLWLAFSAERTPNFLKEAMEREFPLVPTISSQAS